MCEGHPDVLRQLIDGRTGGRPGGTTTSRTRA